MNPEDSLPRDIRPQIEQMTQTYNPKRNCELL